MASFDLDGLRDQGKRLFAGFTTGQKTTLAIAVVALVVGGFLFMRWASEPSYANLFTDLDATDASAITDELDSQGVRYRLADGGATIQVPRSDVYQVRLDLSSQGLPSGGGPGYALLDEQGITTSQFQQEVAFQRALEGELTRTINALDAVRGSSVHLVVPKEDVFVTDTSEASASVLIEAQPGRNLDAGAVQAVVNLVASSVAGMSPEDVTVADTQGRVLSSPGLGEAAGVEMRAGDTRAFEGALAASVQQMLDRVVPAGASVVRVNADLDYDLRASTAERFENGLGDGPGGEPVPLTQAQNEETYTSTDAGGGGILGLDGLPIGGGDSQTEYERTSEDTTYALDRITEEVRAAPGAVERLSVALLLDETQVTVAQAAALQDAVAAAVGFDEERGDQLEVTRLAFDVPEADVVEAEPAGDGSLAAMARAAAAAVLVLGVLLLAWRATKRASARRTPIRVPLDLPELEAGGPGELAEATLAMAAPTPASLDVPDAPVLPGGAFPMAAVSPPDGGGGDPAEGEDDEHIVTRREIDSLIERQPDEVTATIRSWLADRRQ